MSNPYQHPSLSMRVTPEQRERAEHWLQEAYAEGRISEEEFDHRIGQVISSESRSELNQAFYGLVHVPTSSRALGVHPAYQPMVRPEAKDQAGRGVAGLAHLSPFFGLGLIGPGAVYALSNPGSYARREAAKAFNFQLIALISFVLVAIVAGIVEAPIFGFILGLMALSWFALTIVGGVKAFKGQDWRNPVKSVVKLEVLREK